MRQRGCWVVSLLVCCALGCAALAAEVGDLPNVQVEGQRSVIARRAETLVSQLFAHQTTAESLSRWNVPICPLVGGLPRASGEYLLQRLSLRILAVGAVAAPAPCAVNLFVVVTADPEQLLRAWRRKDPRLYGTGYEPQIRRFLADRRPVRVWRNITHDSPGAVSSAQDVPAAALGSGFAGARATQSYSASRLVYTEVRVYDSVIAVVDPRALTGLSLDALADYLTLMTLAEIDPNATAEGVSSVLSLFAHGVYDPEAPTALTPWDLGFLQALYSSDARGTTQRAVITQSITDAIAGAPH